MGQKYLLDTNVVIEYCGAKLPDAIMLKMNEMIESGFAISPVIKIEALGYYGPVADMQKLNGFLNFGDMFYIDEDVIQTTIRLRKVKK